MQTGMKRLALSVRKYFAETAKQYNILAQKNYRISISRSVLRQALVPDQKYLVERIWLTGSMRVPDMLNVFAVHAWW
jgi:hypothetical protein